MWMPWIEADVVGSEGSPAAIVLADVKARLPLALTAVLSWADSAPLTTAESATTAGQPPSGVVPAASLCPPTSTTAIVAHRQKITIPPPPSPSPTNTTVAAEEAPPPVGVSTSDVLCVFPVDADAPDATVLDLLRHALQWAGSVVASRERGHDEPNASQSARVMIGIVDDCGAVVFEELSARLFPPNKG